MTTPTDNDACDSALEALRRQTERIVAVGLALAAFLALTMLGPPRATAVTGGSYKGRTAQGLPVQFEVVANKVENVYYKVRTKASCNQPSGWRPAPPNSGDEGYGTKGSPFTPPGRVKDGKFRIKNIADRSVPPLARGEFVTKRKVEGKLAYGCVSNSGDVSYKYVSFKAKHV